MRLSRLLSFAVMVLLIANSSLLHSQEINPALSAKLKVGLGRYMADIVELPMEVSSTITELDASGKIRKVHHTTYEFQITAQHRDESIENAQCHVRGPRKMLTAWHGRDIAQTILTVAVVMDAMASSPRELTILERHGYLLVLRVPEENSCSAFRVDQGKIVMATEFCGNMQIGFDTVTSLPVSVSYSALGLPITEGKRTLRTYTLENQFRLVSIPGEKFPFLFPAHVRAKFEYASDSLIIESEYSPKLKK